jgi:hypothetical protein
MLPLSTQLKVPETQNVRYLLVISYSTVVTVMTVMPVMTSTHRNGMMNGLLHILLM